MVEQFEIDNLKPRLAPRDVNLGEAGLGECDREDFSGGIKYECDFELNDADNDLLIDLGSIKYSCTVEVNVSRKNP